MAKRKKSKDDNVLAFAIMGLGMVYVVAFAIHKGKS